MRLKRFCSWKGAAAAAVFAWGDAAGAEECFREVALVVESAFLRDVGDEFVRFLEAFTRGIEARGEDVLAR